MHDIKSLRADPEGFEAGLARRGIKNAFQSALEADQAARNSQTLLDEHLAQRNRASKAIGDAKSRGDEAAATALMDEVAALKQQITALEEESRTYEKRRNTLLAAIPNIPLPEVPDGSDESSNREEKRWGDAKPGGEEHDVLAARLGFEPEVAARIAGSRFAVLRGGLARLHRALGQFMIDRQTAAGWQEVAVPLLVRDEAMFGTAQLPKFAEDLFHTDDGRWLISTAEVSLTNLVRETIIDRADLPIRVTALTPCFRSEAGAAGKDTRGLIRQHQFDKVELVTVCAPEESEAEHQRMLRAAEAILEELELPYRRMLLCTGDMGFSSRKTFDLEVWLPGAGTYREISSVSQCGAFQARRMGARFRNKGEKGTDFVHTLNGSGLAVGRALVAVLENYQDADGSVRVPDALIPYMHGLDRLRPVA